MGSAALDVGQNMKTKVGTIVLLALIGIVAIFWFLPDKLPILDARDTVQEENFSKRLRIAADSEESIATSLIAEMPSILGMLPKDLDPAHQDLLASLARKQNDIRDEVNNIKVDLREYLANNHNERYAGVLHAIQQSDVSKGLEQIQERIGNNQSYPAAESAMAWAVRLRHWADQMGETSHDKSK